MRFNIIMEDGGVYLNAIILSTKGMARSKRDVHCALKYEGCITICCKYAVNKRISARDMYDVEEIQEYILAPSSDEEDEDDEINDGEK